MTDTTAGDTGTEAAAATRANEAFGALKDEAAAIAKEQLDRVREVARTTYGRASERADLTRVELDDFVRGRPYEALAFAGLIGLALGLFLKR